MFLILDSAILFGGVTAASIKQIFVTSVLASVVSSALAATQFNTPAVWECDAPGTEGFFVSDAEVPFEQAAAACASLGGALADITNQNFLFATDMVINCVGDNENAWIRSWDYNPTNPQVRDCLAIYVGFTGPGGGINLECGGSRYALCMQTGRRGTSSNVRGYGAYNATLTVTQTVFYNPSVIPVIDPPQTSFMVTADDNGGLTTIFDDFTNTDLPILTGSPVDIATETDSFSFITSIIVPTTAPEVDASSFSFVPGIIVPSSLSQPSDSLDSSFSFITGIIVPSTVTNSTATESDALPSVFNFSIPG